MFHISLPEGQRINRINALSVCQSKQDTRAIPELGKDQFSITNRPEYSTCKMIYVLVFSQTLLYIHIIYHRNDNKNHLKRC